MLNFDSLRLGAADTDEPVIIVAATRQKGERVVAPHSHPRGQLLGSLRGLISVGVEDGLWVVPAIHAVWLPPHHVHSARSHGAFEGWNVFIAEKACTDLPQRPCTVRTSGLLLEAVLRAATWPGGELNASEKHLAAVIIDEIRGLPSEQFGLPLPLDMRLQRVAAALIGDPSDERHLEQWSRWAAVSSRTLSRRFVRETGFTFTDWRQQVRLFRSLEMLAAGTPITTIALDLGYCTASAFIRVFKRTFGETPSTYGKRMICPRRDDQHLCGRI